MKTITYIANPCPRCGAKPWKACRTSEGDRTAMHQSRKTEIDLELVSCGRNIQTFNIPTCTNTFLLEMRGGKKKKYCSKRCHSLHTSFLWQTADPKRYKIRHAKSDKEDHERWKKLATPEAIAIQKEKRAAQQLKHYTPELRTVQFHYNYIFNGKHKNYTGMPFYDAWNPTKGGSFEAGYDWIIENLGPRPKNTSMHIVHHNLGFIPGNLEWTYPKKQSAEQMFKIIANLRHEIHKLKEEIQKLKPL